MSPITEMMNSRTIHVNNAHVAKLAMSTTGAAMAIGVGFDHSMYISARKSAGGVARNAEQAYEMATTIQYANFCM